MKFETLRDGTTVLLREPTTQDYGVSLKFFQNLSSEDRRYLRVDVTKSEIVKRRIDQAVSGEVYRLWAFDGDDVAGDGAVEFADEQWRGHMGELRVIVGGRYQRRGLGTLLIREMFNVCEERGLEKVIIKALAPQLPIRIACEHLGFRIDAVIPDYAKDQNGELQSLLIMSCTMDAWSRQMKDHNKEQNWPDG